MNKEDMVNPEFQPDIADASESINSSDDEIASHILAIAKDEGIHIDQDGNLPLILARIPSSHEIPETAYQLVADVITFLYQTDQEMEEKISGQDRKNMPTQALSSIKSGK